MNAYYDNFQNQISNTRIIEGYFEEIKPRESVWKKLCQKAKAIASSPAMRRFAKPVSLTLSLLFSACVIGAIESGRMGIGTGLLLGGLIVAFEALALRGVKSRS
ncbi:MAG: hypothetical protein IJR88_03865 [Clostridia bacterium]|nr:hypothetical protein [Clostridia bacterium]